MHTNVTDSDAVRRATGRTQRHTLAPAALVTALREGRYSLLSTDLFDTLLLRDRTTETQRLAEACRRAARSIGIDSSILTELRWSFHDRAYQAVAMERPAGDAALSAIYETIATALGLDDDAARLLRATEVEVDVMHLRPNRRLLALFNHAAQAGVRIVAVSDTYYGEADLRRMLAQVVGQHPLAAIYSSADLGVTKHRGLIFDEVAKRENVSADEILHCGDHPDADVWRATAAGWTAVHLPRNARFRAAKIAGRALSLPVQMRRFR